MHRARRPARRAGPEAAGGRAPRAAGHARRIPQLRRGLWPGVLPARGRPQAAQPVHRQAPCALTACLLKQATCQPAGAAAMGDANAEHAWEGGKASLRMHACHLRPPGNAPAVWQSARRDSHAPGPRVRANACRPAAAQAASCRRACRRCWRSARSCGTSSTRPGQPAPRPTRSMRTGCSGCPPPACCCRRACHAVDRQLGCLSLTGV